MRSDQGLEVNRARLRLSVSWSDTGDRSPAAISLDPSCQDHHATQERRMNRIWAGSLAALIGALLVSTQATAQAMRLGYIDSQRIMMEAPGTREAQQEFERSMEGFRSELERLETELETLQANFDRQQGTMTAAVREQRQQEMQQKFVQYQQRRAELEETAQRQQAELVGPIMERIGQVIEQIRAEGGYAMIFDTSTGALISADPALDLTAQVLDRLRAANP